MPTYVSAALRYWLKSRPPKAMFMAQTVVTIIIMTTITIMTTTLMAIATITNTSMSMATTTVMITLTILADIGTDDSHTWRPSK